MNAESRFDQDRWRELADLLGLPADGPSVVSVSAPPAPADASRSLQAKEPSADAEAPQPGEEFTDDPKQGAVMAEPKTERQHEEGRAPRGRRGRGRRSMRDDAEAPDAAGLSSASSASTPEGDQPGGRSEESPDRPAKVRRGRRKSVTSEIAADEGELTLESDVEEIGDYAKWDLPSWEELIASLKRP